MLQPPNKFIGLCWLICLFSCPALAQNNVGIGTSQPNPNAVLELVAPNGNQGFLVPGLSTQQRTAESFTGNLSSDDNGLIVFDMDEKGFYYWNDDSWMSMVGNTQAGGDLAGTYPDPTIREGVVGTAQLADDAVTTEKIANGTLREDDFFSPGAGKVLTTTGSGQVFWDNQSLFGLSFLEQGRVYVGNSGNRPESVDLRGVGNILVGNGTSAAAISVNGDLTLNSSGNAQIVAGAVGTEEVENNSLTNVDINENAAIVGTKINPVFGSQNINTSGNLTAQDINANGNIVILGKATSAATTNEDPATRLTTKGYVDGQIEAYSQDLTGGNGIADFVYNGSAATIINVNNGAGLSFDGNGALQIADQGVTAAKLNSNVAGEGITQNPSSSALELDINGITNTAGVGDNTDLIAIYDKSGSRISKITRENLLGNASLNADNILQGTLNIDRLPDPGATANTFGAAPDFIQSIQVDSKGRVVGVETGSASDIRLKKDIVPLGGTLEQVLKMQGYHYHWKDQSKDNTLQIGVIAQELEKVYPELVTLRSDNYKGVNYLGLIPILIEAIKEQQNTILSLQKQLEEAQLTQNTQQLKNLQLENEAIRTELEMIKAALGIKKEASNNLPAVDQPK